MDIVIEGRNVDITPDIRDYISTKMLHIQRHGPQTGQPLMTLLHNDNQHYQVELSTHLSSGNITCRHQGSDIYASIDSVIEDVDREICKHII
ncbi:Ribosome hibernation promoting factor [BD1-7 clade bacterium]|uniref:Ribosome hibernation promoting factor n=1 Tax=BD1-7 clade bacterium TaxID=2029982 RepID=A0A5S9MQF8_9GAMM|nr:Ribosome hibernation promoting factor [BD1-7 clade bacterium]CAA0081284.1 Ribosome hibernation promoting factor [BD1-7 clade bacterium]CAA0084837.1 Ribosome hibernation promoting factor [BD1-7 clade bacterium]